MEFNAINFAENSATDAVDQAAEYGGIEKSAAAYRDNLADTLTERGVTIDEFNAAFGAFDRALDQGIRARSK